MEKEFSGAPEESHLSIVLTSKNSKLMSLLLQPINSSEGYLSDRFLLLSTSHLEVSIGTEGAVSVGVTFGVGVDDACLVCSG